MMHSTIQLSLEQIILSHFKQTINLKIDQHLRGFHCLHQILKIRMTATVNNGQTSYLILHTGTQFGQ